MEFNFLHVLLLFVTGIAAGFLNTVAFGGSLLALPMLIFLGLPTAVANGTNRVAIFCQNFSAIVGFRRKGVSDFGYSILLAIPAVIGAAIGATIAVDIRDAVFNLILAAVMITMLVLTLINPTERLKNRMESNDTRSKIISMVVFFFIGIYGGFIQAGVGLLVITALRLLTGIDLVRTNAIKVFVIFFYTVVALGIFIIKDKVNWYLGPTLAIGNACGAWLGSHWAVEKGDKWIKVVLIVAVVAFAIRLVWLSVSGS
ncbi:sulfite exporter TauE/SafE family protein [Candidatus Poribacteria bacterium]|nr:sulfite exporter TauE/SafE family protein [Candidatus Poribacteria bacterium]MXV82044.1 sulfite exporter TauE/SafE family protein [Candidatus Poribacteria bacterium]MYA58484.1 sulfite exporter TauE/SafE family protein [Candidatus Poribacteria bacterium]